MYNMVVSAFTFHYWFSNPIRRPSQLLYKLDFYKFRQKSNIDMSFEKKRAFHSEMKTPIRFIDGSLAYHYICRIKGTYLAFKFRILSFLKFKDFLNTSLIITFTIYFYYFTKNSGFSYWVFLNEFNCYIFLTSNIGDKAFDIFLKLILEKK